MLFIATKRAATKEDSIIFQASIAVNVVKTFHLHKKKVSESYELWFHWKDVDENINVSVVQR